MTQSYTIRRDYKDAVKKEDVGGHQGCQMDIFSDLKSQFGSILEGLGMKKVGIFYAHLEYITANWHIL
jgi:hypothetical protein